jgi:outer membrane protein
MLKKIIKSAGFMASVFVMSMTCPTYAKEMHKPTLVDPENKTANWKFALGAGAGYVPKYEGSNNYEVRPVPVIFAEYKKGLFFANSFDGIGSYPLQGKNYKVGISIGYAIRRDEGDDLENLCGMGDVEDSAIVNFLGEYSIGVVSVSTVISMGISGDYGTTAELQLGTHYPLTEKIALLGSVGTIWANKEHISERFGVSSIQSIRSGYSRYDLGSGMKSVGFSIGANYYITENWNVNTIFKVNQLLGDTGDSPIVRDSFSSGVFFTINYSF